MSFPDEPCYKCDSEEDTERCRNCGLVDMCPKHTLVVNRRCVCKTCSKEMIRAELKERDAPVFGECVWMFIYGFLIWFFFFGPLLNAISSLRHTK